jgi:hypothetical protein
VSGGRIRAWARLPVVLAIGALLGACVSIPESSPVRQGREVDVRDEQRVINYIPPRPSPGASQLEIVSGYFAAMLAYPQDFDIAREFLTPEAADAWDPSERVVVYDDQSIIERDGGVEVGGRVLGSLDQRGTWTTTQPGGEELDTGLRLRRVDSEWRIENPLPGLYVDRDHFQRSYAQFALYFFDPTRSVLTPDPVYLLIGESTATELVGDLLRGPTADLSGVAESVAPAGLELDGRVRVSGSGLASIPLTPQVLTLDEASRQLLTAQLTWTLRQLVDVEQISLTLDGEALDIASVGTRIDVDEYSGYDPAGFASCTRQLYALSLRGLVTLDDDGASDVSGPVSRNSVGARSVAVDQSCQLGAVVSGNGTGLSVAGLTTESTRQPQRWLTGVDLLRPSWDVHGLLWVVDRTPAGAVIRVMTGPQDSRELVLPGLTGTDVQGFAVSRDGVRLAAVVARGATARLVIAKIDRPDGRPRQVRLLRLREVLSPDITLTGISGLGWASPTEVALLANAEAGDQQVYDISLDGSTVEGITGFLPSRPVSLAAGSNLDAPLAIGGRNGNIYVQTQGLQWTEVPSEQRLWAPTYPG